MGNRIPNGTIVCVKERLYLGDAKITAGYYTGTAWWYTLRFPVPHPELFERKLMVREDEVQEMVLYEDRKG